MENKIAEDKNLTLLDLNSDCKAEVLNYLPISDIMNLVAAFPEMKFAAAIVPKCYALEIKAHTLDEDNEDDLYLTSADVVTELQDIHTFLKSLGECIKCIVINNDRYLAWDTQALFNSLIEIFLDLYCENMKHLAIKNFDLRSTCVNKNKTKFLNLDALTLDSNTENFLEILRIISKGDLRTLVVLRQISQVQDYEILKLIAESKLKKCFILVNVGWQNIERAMLPAQVNEHLSELNLNHCTYDLGIVLPHFPNLRSLAYTTSVSHSLSPLQNLHKLHHLDLTPMDANLSDMRKILQHFAMKYQLAILQDNPTK